MSPLETFRKTERRELDVTGVHSEQDLLYVPHQASARESFLEEKGEGRGRWQGGREALLLFGVHSFHLR